MEIQGISLLSVQEYNAYIDNISTYFEHIWWLRNPGRDVDKATCVSCHNDYSGTYVGDGSLINLYYYVRPVIIANFKSCRIGDKIEFAKHRWTVISKDMMFIDDDIGDCAFNENIEEGNDYNNSTVKAYCEKWLSSHINDPMYRIRIREEKERI